MENLFTVKPCLDIFGKLYFMKYQRITSYIMYLESMVILCLLSIIILGLISRMSFNLLNAVGLFLSLLILVYNAMFIILYNKISNFQIFETYS